MRGATGRLPAAAPQARLATPRDRSVVRQLECACFGWARWLLGLWPQTGRVGVLGLIAEAGGAPGGRRFPFLGILLVLAAVALLVGQLLPGVGLGSLLLVALGGACAAAWLAGGRPGATVPALVLLAWGLAGVATEGGFLAGIGWTPLAVGTAFLVAWALGGPQRRPRRWALPAGLVLVAVGVLQLGRILPDGWALLWPLILLVAGLWLIRGARMRRG